METSKNKVLLLGWDAADWKVINKLVDQGLMPHMKKLIEHGTIANLASQDPMYSPMLWSSIATGKRAYKHGVHGFSEVAPDGKSVRPVMSVSRKTRAIWNMLTLEGMKSHIVGWWPSHPAEPINGTMISNFYQNHKGRIDEPWPMPKGTVHPESMADHFAQFRVHPQELTGEHIVPFVPNAAKIDQRKDKRLFGVAKITAHASSLHAAFTHIIRTQEWDFAALYLDAIDHYCHGFMKYHPPRRPHISVPDYELYKDVVIGGYRFHDMMLGRIMELIDDQTTLMLISDHGFQPDHLRPRDIPKEPAGPAYEHNPYGIIACMGPGIRKDHITYGASQLDITPTLLHMMGLPVGQDMDGKVITSLFEDQREVKYIPSWDDISGKDGRIINFEGEESDQVAAAAMQQLEDLGYVEKQQGSKEQKLRKTRNECNFNLARAYIDGGLIQEAIPLLENLHQDDVRATRYTFKLAACYQTLGRLSDARKLINELRDQEQYDSPALDMMEGSLLLGERQPVAAIKLFKKAEANVNKHYSRINFQLATAYSMLKRYDDAVRALNNQLEIDPDMPQAHGMLGNVFLTQKKYSEAIDAYLSAVGYDFNNPTYHFGLGKALYLDGRYPEAIKALENSIKIYPDNYAARELSMKIYLNHLDNPSAYQRHKLAITLKPREVIYIVSGMPRSGTSMMMQMLEAGGLEVFTDKVREKDESNPKGYYEHEAVKNIARNSKFLAQATGKAVKIVAPLLHHLPSRYEYKIIFMERDFDEILASQRKMLERDGKKTQEDLYPLKLAEKYNAQIKQLKTWADRLTNVQILYMPLDDVHKSPFLTALMINEFLDNTLLPELMATVVDIDLRRIKLTSY